MWPHKKLKILVPRTPPDTPLPPLTPPRGPGGPNMAKMHSLKSIDDNLCQKSHFWGVKKLTYFFTRNVPSGKASFSFIIAIISSCIISMTKMIIKMTRSNSPSNYVVRSSDGSNIFTDLKISHVEQVDVFIVFIIIIITSSP